MIFASFLVGMFIVNQSNEKFMISRTPSAIRQQYDFTNLRGSSLEVAMRERVISQIEVIKSNEGFGLSLGHFALRNSLGDSLLGCQFYNKVTLTFEAEGVAINGVKPTMQVDGPCENTEDLTKIKAVMIPFRTLMKESPADGDYNFTQPKPVSIKLLNLADNWPDMWHLVGVTLHSSFSDSEAQGGQFIIDRSEIQKIIGQALLINFQ